MNMIIRVVGISYSGVDWYLSFWPRLIEQILNDQSGGKFKVLCYETDKEAKTVSKLHLDIDSSDLVLAVISEKYLESAYCMVEFLESTKNNSKDKHNPFSFF